MEILLNPEIFINSNKENFIYLLLELIDRIKTIQFIFSYDLLAYLMNESNSILTDNNYAQLLAHSFYPNLSYKDEYKNESTIKIDIKNEDLRKSFHRITHTLIDENKNNYYAFCSTGNEDITFNCNCHNNNFTATIFKDFTKFYQQNENKIINDLWQNLKNNFDTTILKLIEICAIKLGKEFMYKKENIRFSKEFQASIIEFNNKYRIKCIEQITKILTFSSSEIKNDQSLKDEPIIGYTNNTRRFYITKDFGRCHYVKKSKNIIFKQLNTDHDRGL